MSLSPIAILFIAVSTLAFEAILFSDSLTEMGLPVFEQPTVSCDGIINCTIATVQFAVSIVKAVWGTIVLLINLLSFNVPGAPWYIRLIIGSAVGGGMAWSIARLIRG